MVPTRIALLVTALAASCTKKGETVPPAAPAAPPAEVRADPVARLDEYVARVMDAMHPPGVAIAIVKDGTVVAAKGYGARERGKAGDVDGDTVFAIASNTKAFIGTTLALLEHEDKLDLDDRVKDRLPGFKTWDPATTSDIRVRDLLTHRSGLQTWAGDLVWFGSSIDTATLLSRLPHLPAEHPFRARFGYSNIMFILAGEVIRAVTGKPWDAVVTERLLTPLGMTRTTTSVAALAELDNVATPHSKQGDADVVDVYVPIDNGGAAGALNASVNDMARWLGMQLGDGAIDGTQIVPPEVVEATRVPHTIVPVSTADPFGRHFVAYGLGWQLYDYRGRAVVSHSGGLPGMISHVAMIPEERLGVVVLTNSESPAAMLIAMAALDIYLGGPTEDYLARALERRAAAEKAASTPADANPAEEVTAEEEAAAPVPPKRAKIKGTFRNPLLGRAVVSDADGLLELRLPDHGGLDCPLTAKADAVFVCVWSNPIFGESDVTFELGRGRASSLRFRVRPSFIDPLEYRFER